MSVLIVGGVFREVIVGEAREVRLAGSGLYAAAAAARLGAETSLLGTVGEDDLELAQMTTDELGVHATWILSPGASGTFGYEIAEPGAVCRGYRPAEGQLCPGSVPNVAPNVVLVFGHPEWDPFTAPGLQESLREATLVWDPQGWMSRTRGRARAAEMAVARRIVLENWGEWLEAEMADRPGSIADVPSSAPAGFDAAVIKDGRWGLRGLEIGQAAFEMAALGICADDGLGSGDVFAGGLAGALDEGLPFVDACERGNAAAAAAISSADPIPGPDFADHVLRVRGLARNPLLLQPARAAARVSLVAGEEILRPAAGVLASLLQAEGFSPIVEVGAATEGISVTAGTESLDPDSCSRDELLRWLGERIRKPTYWPADS